MPAKLLNAMKIPFYFKMLLVPLFLTLAERSLAGDSSASARTPDILQDTSLNGDTVSVKAQFPGGPAAWTKHLLMNLRYPPEAFQKGIEGTVFLHFTVDEKGKIRDIETRGAADRVLKAEAIRILRAGGKWVPSTKNGKSLPSTVEQPIVFKIQ